MSPFGVEAALRRQMVRQPTDKLAARFETEMLSDSEQCLRSR
jgi:hypothetical protein